MQLRTPEGEKRIERHNCPFNCDDGADAPLSDKKVLLRGLTCQPTSISPLTSVGIRRTSPLAPRNNSHLFTKLSQNPKPADRYRCFLVLSSPLACAAFFLPLFLPLFVARKDVVAGELPASATTQVQDGETERERRRKGRPSVEGAEAHVEGTTQGVRLLLKRIWPRRGCSCTEMLTNHEIRTTFFQDMLEHPAHFFKIGGESGRSEARTQQYLWAVRCSLAVGWRRRRPQPLHAALGMISRQTDRSRTQPETRFNFIFP